MFSFGLNTEKNVPSERREKRTNWRVFSHSHETRRARASVARTSGLVDMAAEAGGRAADAVFAEDVRFVCAFRSGDEAAFVSAVTEYANGEKICHAGEPQRAVWRG